jgi:hypothetical protein
MAALFRRISAIGASFVEDSSQHFKSVIRFRVTGPDGGGILSGILHSSPILMSYSLLPAPNSFRFRRPTPKSILNYIQSFLFCLESTVALGIFTASIVALVSHKFIILLLHGPLSILGTIFFSPFVFVFDIITLLLLHRGLASASRAWQIFSGIVGLVITSCSATFVSLYLEANAEVNWGRSVEVSFSRSC